MASKKEFKLSDLQELLKDAEEIPGYDEMIQSIRERCNDEYRDAQRREMEAWTEVGGKVVGAEVSDSTDPNRRAMEAWSELSNKVVGAEDPTRSVDEE